MSDLVVTPVSPQSGCLMTISASLMRLDTNGLEIAVPPGEAWLLYYLESKDINSDAQLSATDFINGSPVTGSRSGVWKPVDTGSGKFELIAQTPLSVRDIGLSVVVVTPDGAIQVLTGAPSKPFAFADSAFDLPASFGAQEITGYSPRVWFNNSLSSPVCVERLVLVAHRTLLSIKSFVSRHL